MSAAEAGGTPAPPDRGTEEKEAEPCDGRRDGRVVDIAPGRVSSAVEVVEGVAVEVIEAVGRQVQGEDGQRQRSHDGRL